MFQGIYAAASGMFCDMQKMEVISGNLANSQTPGYKKNVVVTNNFSQHLKNNFQTKTKNSTKVSSSTHTDFSPGIFIRTDGDLDLCLKSPGFFVLKTPWGQAYTRNGALRLDEEGYLVDHTGKHYLLGQKGLINLAGSQNISISEDGTIFNDGAKIDQLLLVNFKHPEKLIRRSASLFAAPQDLKPKPEHNPIVSQYHLENSNSNAGAAISEMTKMLAVFRHYEACQKVINTEDELIAKTLNELAKV